MTRIASHGVMGALALTLVLAPRAASAQTLAQGPATSAGAATAPTARWNGEAIPLGDGEVRPYVLSDARTGAAIEIGVALSERALEGLPQVGGGHHGDGPMVHTYLLDLPASSAPFRFIELNWNPAGHEPAGAYEGVPHFDFHFYTIERAEREAIVPTDPRFAERANRVPESEFVPAFNAILGPPDAPPAAVAVPMMGVHWIDVRSPELQALLGKPEAQRPFTRTFIHGSWDGRLIFWEPMITRAHLLEKRTTNDTAVRDEVIAVPAPARYAQPGRYPEAYRITWDEAAKEYRIALTRLVPQG